MESISTEQELSLYDLEGKWNDYVGFQKEVLRVLRKADFFEENNVVNTHDEDGYHYAYIGNDIIIDNERVGVRISIKKKVGSNHFWIHNIDEK